MFGGSFSYSSSSHHIGIGTMAYSSPWVENGGHGSIHGNGGVEAPPCKSLRDYIRANESRPQEPSNMSLRECLRANGLREPPRPPPNFGSHHQFNLGNGHIHENGGAQTPPCRSLRDYIRANELRAQEPSNMSLRECIRANGQREPPQPPPTLGGCEQFNLGRGHEGVFSKHYQDFLQTYKNPFDYFREASQIYYHHEPVEYPPPFQESFNANHLDFYPNQ